MKRLIEWFARNGVAANLLVIVIMIGGLLTLPHIRKEIFPEFSSDMIMVTVEYPGAAPEEVEEGVCVRIEEAVQSLDGIKKITSLANENVGTVNIELLPGMDVREMLDDVKARVDAIDTFPEETEKPLIKEITVRKQVLNVAVSGEGEEAVLKRLGEQVRDELAAQPGITQVELANARPYEISIELSEVAMRRFGLTFEEVARAVRRSSLNLPGGSVRTRGGEILLRTKGQAYRGPEFEKIVLLTRPDGTRLLLGDVAHVVDGFAETDQSARFDGKPSVLVQVFRVGEEDALKISDTVRRYIAEAQRRMPAGIKLTIWQDDSNYLRSRMDLLLRNGLYGLVLVLLTLAMFLRFRLALWVSYGILISFLGTLWLMPMLDLSISLISLFAFILVLGIVVDDAIVVGENIYTFQQKYHEGLNGAIRGAQEVAIPVIFGVLTTVAAFFPLMLVSGNTGKIMKVIPLVVIPTLLFSLLESQAVLPHHLSHLRQDRDGQARGLWRRFQGGFASRVEWFIRHAYQPLLEHCLRLRYLTIAGSIFVLMLTLGLVGGGWIKFTFFPNVEGDNVIAFLTMPLGTPAEVTAEAVHQLEAGALKLQQELDAEQDGGDQSVFRHTMASVGEQPYLAASRQGGGQAIQRITASNIGEVQVELAPSEERPEGVSSEEIAQRWRELTGPVPDAEELTFTGAIFTPGDPIDIQFTGSDVEELQRVADTVKAKLAAYPGVRDIADTFRAGKQEIKLQIKPEAEAQGFSLQDLSRQVRQAFYGEEAQRIQRGRDEVKVMVRYPADRRRSLGDLEDMRIRGPGGKEVPFSTVAEADLGRGYATITRVDRRRAIRVTADVDKTKANANDIIADLQSNYLPTLRAEHPSILYSFEGERREQNETLGGVMRGFMLAVLIIYALLAIPLRSYLQPLLVMIAIPFGVVGAVWGHVIMGLDLTILSMFGLVALAGVVVNDSLVLVDFVNRNVDRMPRLQAVRQAGVDRFRAILLTSLTTFAGLTPLILEKSLQAKFLIPMAVSLAFGVIFSTAISLLLLPACYLVLEDIKGWFKEPEAEPVGEAVAK